MPNTNDAGAAAPAFVLRDLKSADVWQMVRVLRRFKLAEALKLIDNDLLKKSQFKAPMKRNEDGELVPMLPDEWTAGQRKAYKAAKKANDELLWQILDIVVDNIGGITVTNDLNRTLYLDGCTYRIGDNNVNGECALRFARERKSYESGDRHRGENQEEVITRIIEKISSDKNIVLDYNKILNSLDGSFDSDIDSDDISALVKMQLDDMSSWTVESYNINGSGAYAKTNSYPGQDLYVMMTDANTVNTAKEKIKATLNATK